MTYFIRWLQDYGWMVYVANQPNDQRIIISGWRGADLNHILTWCGSTGVTILPSTK